MKGSANEINIQKKHFEVYYRYIENSNIKLSGADQKEWLNRYNSEIDNIRESLKWGIVNDPESAIKLALEFASFCDAKYYYFEALEFMNQILSHNLEFESNMFLNVLRLKGQFLKQTGSLDEAAEILMKCCSMADESGDMKTYADAMCVMGIIDFEKGEYKAAKENLDKCLEIYSGLKDYRGIAFSKYCLGGIAYMETEYRSSKILIEDSLSIYREMKDLKQIGISLGNLGTVEFQLGNLQNAHKLYSEYLSISRELENKKGIAYALLNISYVHNENKEFETAKELQQESLEIGNEIGNKNITALSLLSLGSSELKLKDLKAAEDLFLRSFKLFNELKDKYQIVENILLLSEVYLTLRELSRSAVLISAFEALYKILGIQMNKLNEIEFETNLKILRSELTEREFEIAWKSGQSANFENISKVVSF